MRPNGYSTWMDGWMDGYCESVDYSIDWFDTIWMADMYLIHKHVGLLRCLMVQAPLVHVRQHFPPAWADMLHAMCHYSRERACFTLVGS